MVAVELNDRELSIIINSMQKEGLGVDEATLLKKLSDIYKTTIEKSPPPE